LIKSPDLVDFYEREGLAARRYSGARFWERRYHTTRQAIVQDFLGRAIGPKTRFVDLGCGSGEYLRFARQLTPHVFGLDLSLNYLHRSRSLPGAHLVRGDVCRTPFNDHAFDVVLLSEVLEHVPDPDTLVRELFRLSVRTVLVSTPNEGLIRRISRRLVRPFVERTDASVGHISILPFDSLLARFQKPGWSVRRAFTLHIFPPTLDQASVPASFAPLIRFLERALDLMFPSLGTISFVLVMNDRPEEWPPQDSRLLQSGSQSLK